MLIKISDAEMAVMDYIWKHGECKATDISVDIATSEGIDRNTAYTYIQRLLKKGFIKRRNPGFYCSAAISKEDIQRKESQKFLDKLFDGSFSSLVKCMIDNEELSKEDIDELKSLIEKKKD